MKKIKGIICSLLTVIMLFSFSIPSVKAEGNSKNITILFTHDMHNHLQPFMLNQDNRVIEIGGYARLKSVIDMEKSKDPNAILVDAGDFSMGTLFQSIYSSDSPDIRLLGEMGYDVTTFGNHEFDFRPSGLAKSLNVALDSGDRLPQLVASNVTFPKDKEGNLTESLATLKDAMDRYGVKDYTIIERNGVKIGLFGLVGKDAKASAPMAEVEFTDAVENAKRVVSILKNKEKVELIVCLSHLGISTGDAESEDEVLAEKVPDIDVIISGHSHTKLVKPIIAGKTIIASCGEYAENLGVINLSLDSNNKWKLNNYNLRQIDNSVQGNVDITQRIEGFKKIVEDKYLNNFALKFDDILARTNYNFISASKIGADHREEPLGNLITDAYIYAVKMAEGTDYEPIMATVEPSGVIRGSFVKGNITVSDVFTTSSLGLGADGISGYPLISVYLTGKELKTACEVDASISPIMTSAQLYMSGISFKFNPNRLIFNKVTDAKLQGADGSLEKIDDKKLYRVVTGLYSAQMLSIVGEKSFGLMSLVPKTKDGKPIIDFEAQIIKYNSNGKKTELKEWIAIAEYLKSFDKVNGVPQVPEYYNQTHNRKIVDDNHNIFLILANPNTIALVVYAIVIVIITLIIFIIIRVAKRIKRKRSNKTIPSKK